jgi:DNA-binding NarL/FixJ family response regulator
MVREGLHSMLGEAVAEWLEAGTGEEALRRLEESKPDLVLLDLQLAEEDGLTLLAEIRGRFPSVAVLVVTMHDRVDFVRQAMRLGAVGYVLKGATRREILAAVQTAHGGGSIVDPRLLKRLIDERSAPGGGEPEDLTAVERDLLVLIAQGLTNREIALKLRWSVGTVKKYVQRILEKLDVSDRTQAAAEAVRRGLIEIPPPAGTPRG